MIKFRLKYLLLCSFFLVIHIVAAQTQNNDAVVTIVGDPVPEPQQPPQASDRELRETEKNIEPTFENGFHMRFQIEGGENQQQRSNPASGATASIGRSTSSSSYSSSAGGTTRAKKRTVTMTQRSFNMKKRVKKWIPKRHRKYRPTLCEKFR